MVGFGGKIDNKFAEQAWNSYYRKMGVGGIGIGRMSRTAFYDGVSPWDDAETILELE